nr:hypothetical protein [uncultured Sediminibacterium sp.]
MRIFLGISEVANFISSYKRGFEKNGHETFTMLSLRNKFYSNAVYDVVLADLAEPLLPWPGIFKRIVRSIKLRTFAFYYFFKALLTCDVFFYNTGGAILPYALDYKLAKFFGKKIVVIFLGSEIRHWYTYQVDIQRMGYYETFKTGIEAYRNQRYALYTQILNRIALAETYADIILSHPSYAQLQRKPYMRGKISMDLEYYKFNVPGRLVPIIVHAPSARGVKGTEYVLEAIEILRNEGILFDFRLIENMPNDELIVLLSDSDIVVDELNSDAVGVLSHEGMATGNAVLTSYLEEYMTDIDDFPIINTNKYNLLENLKRVIVDVNYRTVQAQKGRSYIEVNNEMKAVTGKLLDMLYSKDSFSFDIVPDGSKYIEVPEEILLEECRNFKHANSHGLGRSN